jgi:hypothetical protein
VWENFEEFWKVIFEIFCTKAHVIEKYHDLIEFLWSWFDFKNNKVCLWCGPNVKPRFGGG